MMGKTRTSYGFSTRGGAAEGPEQLTAEAESDCFNLFHTYNYYHMA